MLSIRPFLLAALCVAVAAAVVAPASASEGQKLDSGLGELPHYAQWADKSGRLPVAVQAAVRVPGESLDSGLGELPHYRFWADKFTRSPQGRAAQVASR